MARWKWCYSDYAKNALTVTHSLTQASNAYGSNLPNSIYGKRCAMVAGNYSGVGTQVIFTYTFAANVQPDTLVLADIYRLSTITNQLNRVRSQYWNGSSWITADDWTITAGIQGGDRNLTTAVRAITSVSASQHRIMFDFSTSANDGLMLINRSWLCNTFDPGMNPNSVSTAPQGVRSIGSKLQGLRPWPDRKQLDTHSMRMDYVGVSLSVANKFKEMQSTGYATLYQSDLEPLWGASIALNVKIEDLEIRRSARDKTLYDVAMTLEVEA